MALMPRSFFISAGVGLVAALPIVAAVAGPGVIRSGDEAASAVTEVSSGEKTDRRKRGKDVTVDAPYADIDVNTDRRRVRVLAPFADVDVRW